MKAVRLHAWEQMPRLFDIPVPEPGPGEVLLKIAGAGVCHSDLHVMEWKAGALPYELPFTLGHEAAGFVAKLGAGVKGVAVGDAVAVYGPWGCGLCRNCARGKENLCLRAQELKAAGGGLGRDGAMAEYMIVPSPRLLAPLGKLDPRDAAPLTDAALTPYHAIKRWLPTLVPGTTTVVIGTGGLGHMAVQLLRALSPTQIVAIDKAEDKRALARESGAHLAVAPDEASVKTIRDATAGFGADLVLDFVGVDATLDLAAKVAGVGSALSIVGLAGGKLPMQFGTVPLECAVSIPYWGTRDELIEVLRLAERGAIRVHVQRFPLAEFAKVYELLRAGKIQGRAVLLPH